MKLHIASFDSPFGLFSVALNASAEVVATAFGDIDVLLSRWRGTPRPELEPAGARAAKVREQVEEYAAGRRTRFCVGLAPLGTPFQREVWAALTRIPCGETRSYGQLADALGSSPRAVGAANGANPICLLVPCHRVIGSDGGLTGFAFGTDLKAQLLRHERRVAAAA